MFGDWVFMYKGMYLVIKYIYELNWIIVVKYLNFIFIIKEKICDEGDWIIN